MRVRRAQLKRDLKAGRVHIEEILLDAAGVRLDGQGVRHAHGGAEVRSGEGGTSPEPLPDQPVQDRRRPLRAAAHRARRALQPPLPDATVRPLAPGRPVFVVTGPSGAGKGTLIKGLVERVPALEVAVSATTRPQRPGEVDGREYWFLTRRRVRAPCASRASSSSTSPYVSGTPLRDAALGDGPDRRRGQGVRARARARGRAARCRRRSRGA